MTSSASDKFSVFILLKQPAYVIVPVKIDNYWYDNSDIMVFKTIDALARPKRFVSALILGITAFITILTYLAVSTTGLVQDIHSVSHIIEFSRNVSLALVEQELIEQKLETKVNALEDTVIW